MGPLTKPILVPSKLVAMLFQLNIELASTPTPGRWPVKKFTKSVLDGPMRVTGTPGGLGPPKSQVLKHTSKMKGAADAAWQKLRPNATMAANQYCFIDAPL